MQNLIFWDSGFFLLEESIPGNLYYGLLWKMVSQRAMYDFGYRSLFYFILFIYLFFFIFFFIFFFDGIGEKPCHGNDTCIYF